MVWAPMVEHLAAGAAGVLRGGVEQDADVAAGVRDVVVVVAADGDLRRWWPGVRPTMTRMVVVLPAPLGPRKPVTQPGLAIEADVVDGGEAPYFLVSPSTLIMRHTLPDIRPTRSRLSGRSPARPGQTS